LLGAGFSVFLSSLCWCGLGWPSTKATADARVVRGAFGEVAGFIEAEPISDRLRALQTFNQFGLQVAALVRVDTRLLLNCAEQILDRAFRFEIDN
jgi:hypothetical protein